MNAEYQFLSHRRRGKNIAGRHKPDFAHNPQSIGKHAIPGTDSPTIAPESQFRKPQAHKIIIFSGTTLHPIAAVKTSAAIQSP